MVQIVNMSPNPSIGASFGQGFEGGMQQSVNAGISYKLQDMLDSKRQARQQDIQGQKGLAALKVLNPQATEEEKMAAYHLGPEFVEMLINQRGANALKNLFSGLVNTQPNNSPEGSMIPETGGGRSIEEVEEQPQQQPQVNIQGMPDRQNPQATVDSRLEQPKISQQPVLRKAPHEMNEREWAQEKENTPYLTAKTIKEADAIRKTQIQNEGIKADIELKRNDDRRKEEEHALRMKEKAAELPKNVQKYVDHMEGKRQALEDQEFSLDTARKAAASGKTSGLVQYFANKFHFEPLISPESAILEAASKNFMMANLKKSGAKPNMWLEQQIKSMFLKVGKTDEANKEVGEFLAAQQDMDRNEMEIFDKLAEQDIEKHGKIQNDIQRRVDKEKSKYTKQRVVEYSKNIQKIKEEKLTNEQMARLFSVDKGTPLTEEKAKVLEARVHGDRKKMLKLAIRLGYDIPEQE